MSLKNTTGRSTSSTLIGVILPLEARVMNPDQLFNFTKQILAEDGNLGCLPAEVFMMPQLGGNGIKLMWTFDNYNGGK